MLAPGRAPAAWRRASRLLAPRNDAQLAAAAWACEMTALEAAADAMPDRRSHGRTSTAAWRHAEARLATPPGFFGFRVHADRLRRSPTGP